MGHAKYVLLVPEGCSGRPLADLDGLTPLEAARTPNLDRLAAAGRVGMAATTPPGGTCSTESTFACLLGYDPLLHPLGRARLDVCGLVPEGDDPPIPDDWAVYRLDFVTVGDGGAITPPPCELTLPETRRLLDELGRELRESFDDLPELEIRPLAPGVGLLLVAEDIDGEDSETVCQPLGTVFGRPRRHRHRPVGPQAEVLQSIVEASEDLFDGHEINALREETGQPPVHQVWVWGGGAGGPLPPFSDMQRGAEGTLIADDPAAVGLARRIGWSGLYRQKLPPAEAARHAIAALGDADLVCLYLTAPARAGYAGDLPGRIEAIESIDREIVPPLQQRLEQQERWRMLVAPTLSVHAQHGTHEADPVPFLLSGFGMSGVVERRYNEPEAADSDLFIEVGHELMEYFLFGAGMRNLDR